MQFVKFVYMSQWPTKFENNSYFDKYSTDFHVLSVYFDYSFVRNRIKLIISCLNVSFKKLIVWLQLHPKLIASDYITTERPLGRTKGVHSCVTPQGAWGGGSEAWLANPSSLTYFNTNGRVSGLGKTSWNDKWLIVYTPESILWSTPGFGTGPIAFCSLHQWYSACSRSRVC